MFSPKSRNAADIQKFKKNAKISKSRSIKS